MDDKKDIPIHDIEVVIESIRARADIIGMGLKSYQFRKSIPAALAVLDQLEDIRGKLDKLMDEVTP